jgi:hypothetical protein
MREAAIAYYRWARHDLQQKDPTHPDLLHIVHRLRDLRAERHTQPPCALITLWRWL